MDHVNSARRSKISLKVSIIVLFKVLDIANSLCIAKWIEVENEVIYSLFVRCLCVCFFSLASSYFDGVSGRVAILTF